MRRVSFVEATGGRAAIGALTQIEQIVEGKSGTQVVPRNGRSHDWHLECTRRSVDCAR